MFDGLPEGLKRLSLRLVPPGAMRRAYRQAVDIVKAPFARTAPTPDTAGRAGSISEVAAFGSNPGRLRMLVYVPKLAPRLGAPLIVVLHGCGQDAAQFAEDSGWIAMAERLGAPLVLPAQRAENNRGRCFNWFRPTDIRHGTGEVLSIRQMVANATARFGSDAQRVFVVGLSAGGAMTAACLAAYPDIFAAGAVVAGLPIGSAASVPSAMSLMNGRAPRVSAADWAACARALAPAGYAGQWPRISLWQGTGDRTVASSNAEALAAQWTALHGLGEQPERDETVAPTLRRRVWTADGRGQVESWTIEAMAHGYPIDAGTVTDRFVQPAGIDEQSGDRTLLGPRGDDIDADAASDFADASKAAWSLADLAI